ncbi:MAG: glutamate-1-semialdehyde 2,1-aminomutase [Lachnospiraceae bacterium]
MSRSEELFERAVKVIPGGVNSPVRAFRSVGGTPRFIVSAQGACITDEDGETYLDYIGSWGPMILGHNQKEVREKVTEACMDGLSFGAPTQREVIMAEMICDMVPGMEMVRMVNSGTEAVMSALRAARGFTGRSKIVKFAGCYHGHSDSILIKAGSGVMEGGVPDSSGVTKGCTEDTLSAVYNDLDSVQAIFDRYPDQVAAVIVEPIAANMGVVVPAKGFLEGLRELCTKYGALLIFDEVITGFRLAAGGAQEYFGIQADLVTYGKIIGGGMPVGAYGGRREIMSVVSPLGPVYQAGTLSGNPIAMAAGIAQLTILRENPDIYRKLNEMGTYLFDSIDTILKETGAPCTINHEGSLGSIFFTPDPVVNYETAQKANTAEFGRYFHYMLDNHVHLGPSQFEAMFVSAAHTKEDIDRTLELIRAYFR